MEGTLTESLIREAILMGLESVDGDMTREQTTEIILGSIKTALRLEARMNKSESAPVATPTPPKARTAIPTPGLNAEDSMIFTPDVHMPPQVPVGKPLIVMPDSPEAREPVSKVLPSDSNGKPPLRISSLRKPAKAKDPWAIEELSAYLHANTPTTLEIVPNGLKTTVTLVRNILTAAPLGCSKVTYTLQGMSGDRAGQMGLPEDQTVIAAVLGRFVFKNFYVSDPLDLQLPRAMEELKASARDVFQRRDRQVNSHTPYRPGGHLRIEVGDNGRVSDPSIPGAEYIMDLSVPE